MIRAWLGPMSLNPHLNHTHSQMKFSVNIVFPALVTENNLPWHEKVPSSAPNTMVKIDSLTEFHCDAENGRHFFFSFGFLHLKLPCDAMIVILSMSSLSLGSRLTRNIAPARRLRAYCIRLHFILRLQRQPICLLAKKKKSFVQLIFRRFLFYFSFGCRHCWRLLLRFSLAISVPGRSRSFVRSIILASWRK